MRLRLPSSLDAFDVLLQQFVDELAQLDSLGLRARRKVVLDSGLEVHRKPGDRALAVELAARAGRESDLLRIPTLFPACVPACFGQRLASLPAGPTAQAAQAGWIHSYDIRDRMWQIADPLGNLTRFDYNSRGLVTRMFGLRNEMTQFAYSLTDLSSVTDSLERVVQTTLRAIWPRFPHPCRWTEPSTPFPANAATARLAG